ncbi:MAG TPA: glucosaminidase domain-containing protein [Chitinophagaceae bacterium]|nr:glucosaminidase domain-containing protein [Chitinophagaceae bacterium]
MKKLQLTLLSFFTLFKLFSQSSVVINNYISEFKDIAIKEMHRTGVPASITLAQGIHETSAGQSPLVIKSNNHFGIKCKSDWQGPSVSHDDDARGECFRKYESPFESYKDHSDFLATRSHYGFLFKLDPTDYEGWAHGLKKAGYATNPKYPQILIKLIETYNLQDYTLIAMGRKPDNDQDPDLVKIGSEKISESSPLIGSMEKPKPIVAYPSGIFKINDTRVVFIPKGTSFLSLAYEYNVPLKRLFEFNDMNEQEMTTTDQLVYLQRKRKTGVDEFYKITGSETLHDIAQKEGVRLESLLSYNFLRADMRLQEGEVLYLQGNAPVMPKLISATAVVRASSSWGNMAKSAIPQGDDHIVHTVQPKETLYSISKRYSVDKEDVIKWNDLQSVGLKTGQQLRIKRM